MNYVHTAMAGPEASTSREYRGLSRRAFWIVVVLAVAVFLVIDNPLLGNPFAIDRSILWSYGVLPPLVVIALLIERRLRAREAVIETILAVTVKFGITYGIAIGLWIIAGEPPPDPPREPIVAAAPAPEWIYSAEGRASRWQASGAPPSAVQHLSPGPATSDAPVRTVRVEEVLSVEPLTPGLHTANAVDAQGRHVFNWPILPQGGGLLFRFHEALGRVRLVCTVHGEAEVWPTLDVVAAAP